MLDPSVPILWVCAYAIHSTVLVGLVWLLLRVWRVRSLPVREALWTVALFGGLATATAQVRLGLASWTIDLEMPGSWFAAARETHGSAGSEAGHRGARGEPALLVLRTGEAYARTPPAEVEPSGRADAGRAAIEATGPAGSGPNAWMLLCAAVLALASVSSLVLTTVCGLRDRTDVRDRSWLAELERLRVRAGLNRRVRLTHSRRLASPVAFGLVRPEICVPSRSLGELSPPLLRAMLAHEMAHLVRGDPLRLLFARLVETVFFFQPLNRLARHRLFEVVESRCDAWAVQRTGHGVALAECLAEVAGWLSEARLERGVAMARSRSSLARRVRSLLSDGEALAEEVRWRRAAPAAALLLPLVTIAAPAIGGSHPRGAEVGSAPASAPGGRTLRHEAEALEREIESLARQVNELRAVMLAAPAARPWLGALERIERRLESLDERRRALRALRRLLMRGDGLAPEHAADERHPYEPAEASGR